MPAPPRPTSRSTTNRRPRRLRSELVDSSKSPQRSLVRPRTEARAYFLAKTGQIRVACLADARGLVRHFASERSFAMALRSLIAALSLVFVAGWSVQGCSTNAHKIEPETRGKRGKSCLARNDCAAGLACINGICAKNEFNISVTAKQCTRVECDTTDDCCGGKATEAPTKCDGRNEIC